ncbi:MAG: ParA family protein [candidate division Zixibacteria bacterium]
MSRVIAVMNQKGGVGKTTTAVNLGAALSEKSYKVLLIDLDPSGNMTQWLSGEYSKEQIGLSELLESKNSFGEVYNKSEKLNLDFVPAGGNLGEIASESGLSLYTLKNRMEHFSADYDFILFDCPPSSDILIGNALFAADSILIPIQTEALPLRAGARFLNWLEDFTGKNGNSINILGILPCMYDSRTRLSRIILETMKASENIGPLVFNTIIRKNVRLAELSGQDKSIFKSASKSYGASDYIDLADEVIERTGAKQPVAEIKQPEKIKSVNFAERDATEEDSGELVYQDSGSAEYVATEKEEKD